MYPCAPVETAATLEGAVDTSIVQTTRAASYFARTDCSRQNRNKISDGC